jgi:hypothetical protein
MKGEATRLSTACLYGLALVSSSLKHEYLAKAVLSVWLSHMAQVMKGIIYFRMAYAILWHHS